MVAYLHKCHPQTWGRYGFFDSYNLAVSPEWYSHSLYGIDKGCSMLMIENYLTRLVWDAYTGSPQVLQALDILGFRLREREREAVLEPGVEPEHAPHLGTAPSFGLIPGE
jgi:hypothetical protein